MVEEGNNENIEDGDSFLTRDILEPAFGIIFLMTLLLILGYVSFRLLVALGGLLSIVDGSISFAVRWSELDTELTIRQRLEFAMRFWRIHFGFAVILVLVGLQGGLV